MNSLRVFLPIKMPFIELKNNIYLSFITRDLNCSKTFGAGEGRERMLHTKSKRILTSNFLLGYILKVLGKYAV